MTRSTMVRTMRSGGDLVARSVGLRDDAPEHLCGARVRRQCVPHLQVGGWRPAGDRHPRLDNNPFFAERLQAAVDQQLAARGFEKMTSERADLLLHFHARVEQQLDVRAAILPTTTVTIANRRSTTRARSRSTWSTHPPTRWSGAAGQRAASRAPSTIRS